MIDAWHIVRTEDTYYAATVRGTREDAERVAAQRSFANDGN